VYGNLDELRGSDAEGVGVDAEMILTVRLVFHAFILHDYHDEPLQLKTPLTYPLDSVSIDSSTITKHQYVKLLVTSVPDVLRA
jgi:hypothetical protein